MFSNTSGRLNTAIGDRALVNNTTGGFNTATSLHALVNNTTGNNNVALGALAGSSQTTGSNNIYIGGNIPGVAGESDACYIASIFGQTSADGIAVLINSSNKLGTTTSSERFKKDIATMNKTSEAVLSLRPVTFHYKSDAKGIPQFGLIAEEVAKVNPALVLPDKGGKPYTVRYDAVNAMLLNEFLKEHQKVQKLEATVVQQQENFQTKLAEQQKQIDALTAGLQRVSAQLELSKPAPQTVLNNQ
jgi:Chaperone of endosialidase